MPLERAAFQALLHSINPKQLPDEFDLKKPVEAISVICKSGKKTEQMSSKQIKKFCTAVGQLTTLKKFTFTGHPLGGKQGKGKALLSSLLLNKSLEELDLSNNGLEDHVLDVLVLLPCLKSTLRSLTLSGNYFGICGLTLVNLLLTPNGSIRELNLSNCKLTEDLISRLSEILKKKPPLQHLDLSYNGVTDRGCKAILDMLETNDQLQALNLSYNDITGDSCKEIVEMLGVNQKLQNLDLSHNLIDQKGCAILSTQMVEIHKKGTLKLEYLRLFGNGSPRSRQAHPFSRSPLSSPVARQSRLPQQAELLELGEQPPASSFWQGIPMSSLPNLPQLPALPESAKLRLISIADWTQQKLRMAGTIAKCKLTALRHYLPLGASFAAQPELENTVERTFVVLGGVEGTEDEWVVIGGDENTAAVMSLRDQQGELTGEACQKARHSETKKCGERGRLLQVQVQTLSPAEEEAEGDAILLEDVDSLVDEHPASRPFSLSIDSLNEGFEILELERKKGMDFPTGDSKQEAGSPILPQMLASWGSSSSAASSSMCSSLCSDVAGELLEVSGALPGEDGAYEGDEEEEAYEEVSSELAAQGPLTGPISPPRHSVLG